MKSSVMRTAIVALTATAVLLTAGCAADEPTDEPTASASEEQADETPAVDPDAPVEVPDVTVLILETASGNLIRAGLTPEVVDETGAPVDDEDPTAWVVTAQDPAEGTVDPGTVVTLTVKPRG